MTVAREARLAAPAATVLAVHNRFRIASAPFVSGPVTCARRISPLAIRAQQRAQSTQAAPEASNKKFLGKVSYEFGNAFDGLAAELHVTSDERARITEPERTTRAPFSFTKDDGSVENVTGFRTVFSTLLGPGKGGLRVVANLDADMVKALAFEMCPKAAITGVPVGGAKGGFALNAAALSRGEFARAMRGFVTSQLDAGATEGRIAFGPHADVPAPDVGTSPPGIALMDICTDAYLGWLAGKGIDDVAGHKVPAALRNVKADGDGTGTPFLGAYRAAHEAGEIPNLALLATFTGKSVPNGGSLKHTEATGLGVAFATLQVLKSRGATSLEGKTVAVQGYGNVGQGAVQAFTRLGASVTSIAEFDGSAYAVRKSGGFTPDDVAALDGYKAEHKTLRGFPGSVTIDMRTFWSQAVDVLAPCARENELNEKVAELVNAGIVVEGANGPTSTDADIVLARRGKTVIPDVFANAGGVTVSEFEMEQNLRGEHWTQPAVREKLEGRVESGFARIFGEQVRGGGTLRQAAYRIAVRDLVGALRAREG